MRNCYLFPESKWILGRTTCGRDILSSSLQTPNLLTYQFSISKALPLTSWLFRVSLLKITLWPLNRRSRSKVSQLSSFPSQKQRTYKVQWYLFHWYIKKICNLSDLRTNLNENNVDILNQKNCPIGPRNCPQKWVKKCCFCVFAISPVVGWSEDRVGWKAVAESTKKKRFQR